MITLYKYYFSDEKNNLLAGAINCNIDVMNKWICAYKPLIKTNLFQFYLNLF